MGIRDLARWRVFSGRSLSGGAMTRQLRRPDRGPVFVIKLRPVRPDSDGIRGLRAILKSLLRRHGFRRITACEELINNQMMEG